MTEEVSMKKQADRYDLLRVHMTQAEALVTIWGRYCDPDLIQILREKWEVEDAFRAAQERYDRFAARHYDDRYEPWYDEVSERYKRRIRRLYFQLRRMDRFFEETWAGIADDTLLSLYPENQCDVFLRVWDWLEEQRLNAADR